MSSIEVYRGAGDRPGAPIVDPLLSDEVLIVRGLAEMDRHAHVTQDIEMDTVFIPGVRLGQLGAVADPSAPGGARRGRVTGVALSFDGSALECRLTLEAPT
jgi:hypothetical protein